METDMTESSQTFKTEIFCMLACIFAVHASVAGKVCWSGLDWLFNTVHTSRSAVSRSLVHL